LVSAISKTFKDEGQAFVAELGGELASTLCPDLWSRFTGG
jgi:hypothetical protein